jgi:hypothetical protein
LLLDFHLLLELEGEVVFVFNELVFAPIVDAVVVATECEKPEWASSHE